MTNLLPPSTLPEAWPGRGTTTLLAGWSGFVPGKETPAATGHCAGRAVLQHGESSVERLSKGLVVHHPFPGSQCPRIDLEAVGLTSGSFIISMSVDRVGADWQPTGRVAHLMTVESDGFFLYRHLLGVGIADMTDLHAAFLGTQYAGGNDGAFYRTTVNLIRTLHLVVHYDAPCSTLSLFTLPAQARAGSLEKRDKPSFLGSRTLDLGFEGSNFRYKHLTLGGWHDGSNALSMTVRNLQIWQVKS